MNLFGAIHILTLLVVFAIGMLADYLLVGKENQRASRTLITTLVLFGVVQITAVIVMCVQTIWNSF